MEESCHVHNENCGHPVVRHGDHLCYKVNNSLHYYNQLTNKCESHGNIHRDVNIENFYPLRKYHLDWEPTHVKKSFAKFIIMLVLTAGFFFVELIVGIMVGSIALQADAFHMLSDILGLVVGFWAASSARKKKDLVATYGYNRMEIIGSLINATFLMASCVFITISAIHRLIHFEEEQSELREQIITWMIVAAVGLSVNIIGLFSFGTCCHSGEGGHSHNMNERGVYLHILGDALGSIAVVISAIIIYFVDSPYALLTDPISSLLIVVIILYNSFNLAKESIHILMHKIPDEMNLEEINDRLLGIDRIKDVHDLHIWSLDQQVRVGSVHVVLDESSNIYSEIDLCKEVFHNFNIHSTTIQPEKPHGIESIEAQCQDLVCHQKDCIR